MDDIRVVHKKSRRAFIVTKPDVEIGATSALKPAVALSVTEAPASLSKASTGLSAVGQVNWWREQFMHLLHKYSIAAYAILILAIAVAAAPLVRNYLSSDIKLQPMPVANVQNGPPSGINMAVTAGQLQSSIQSIISQKATLNLGSQTVAIAPSTIKSWLEISANSGSTKYDIHLDAHNIATSLSALANSYTSAPVNEVTATRPDGSTEEAIAGQNGSQLSDPASIAAQAVTIARNLFSNGGFQVNAPLVSMPFQSVTPAAFSKLLLVDLTSKRMYAYQNGQVVNTFLVSAGKPSTPTPVGEFHIWEKWASQTMTGPGYVQPNVPWINYFDHSGDAVHGVYWRPASVFGNINTSHGCVGIPVDQAEWVYNWAPIGTTVITTSN